VKKIYIVLTYTGTILSKIVKIYTRKEFSHVSISLDEDLERMYSFGRINAYNPFWGGFVQESVDTGTFKRFKNTKTRIYSLQVDDEQYDKVVQVINDIKNKKSEYNFNILGLIGVVLHYKVKREKHFYCAEFVKYVLEKSNVVYDLPELVKPEDFKEIDNLEVVYTGMLKEYGG
jgi:hypothetical protein